MCPYVNEFVGVGIHVCVDGHIHADFFLVASLLMDAVQNPFGRSTDFFNCAVLWFDIPGLGRIPQFHKQSSGT